MSSGAYWYCVSKAPGIAAKMISQNRSAKTVVKMWLSEWYLVPLSVSVALDNKTDGLTLYNPIPRNIVAHGSPQLLPRHPSPTTPISPSTCSSSVSGKNENSGQVAYQSMAMTPYLRMLLPFPKCVHNSRLLSPRKNRCGKLFPLLTLYWGRKSPPILLSILKNFTDYR